eukprot:Gb_14384 [translate_table: standard]
MVSKNHANGKEEISSLNQRPQLAKPAFPKKMYNGALDLLLDAIQLSAFDEEDERYFSIAHHRKTIKNTHQTSTEINRKAFFIHRGVPISQKRVLRRAKNVYKSRRYISAHIMLPAKELGSLVIASGMEKSAKTASEEEGNRTEGKVIERDFIDEDGKMEPLARSKRGRSQILPSRYSDSVLQPWKRGTRFKKEMQ